MQEFNAYIIIRIPEYTVGSGRPRDTICLYLPGLATCEHRQFTYRKYVPVLSKLHLAGFYAYNTYLRWLDLRLLILT